MKDIDGQISLFDILNPQKASHPIEEYLKEAIMRGTGFSRGKERVYELYHKDMTQSERAEKIKKEYGICGAGWPIEGYGLHGYDTYHGGFRIEWRDEIGDHEKLYNWNEVEKVIHSLVDSGEYYKPKKRICSATNQECNHEGCKEVAIKCLDIDCKVECCQACAEDCGARCNYSAHQPKVRKEYQDIEHQTWVDNPNYKTEMEESH